VAQAKILTGRGTLRGVATFELMFPSPSRRGNCENCSAKEGVLRRPVRVLRKVPKQTNLSIVTILPCSLGIVLGTNLPGRARTRSHACSCGIVSSHKSVCSLSRPQERKIQKLNTRQRKLKILSSKVTHIVYVLGSRSDEVDPLRPEPTDTRIWMT